MVMHNKSICQEGIMSVVHFGKTVTELRRRKMWQQERVVDNLASYFPVIHRLEKGAFLPRDEVVHEILNALESPIDEFVCAHIETQDMRTSLLCADLTHALGIGNLDEAIEIYAQIVSIEGVTSQPIAKQFLLSQKARMMELVEEPDDRVLSIVKEAIGITYENLTNESPGWDVLVFDEPELFHTLARVSARQGNVATAIQILTDTKNGLLRQPTGERERDRRISPILLTLTNCQLMAHAYEDAHDTCELGFHISATRGAGQDAPEFILRKAQALQGLGRLAECAPLLKMAYAGFLILGQGAHANNATDMYQDLFGEKFNAYGMETLNIPQIMRQNYARGSVPQCSHVGEMIHILRKEAGLSLAELSQGICSIANLGKLENKRISRHMHYVEPLLERLGRDALLYCNFFLRADDFEARELRDLIDLLMTHHKYDEAAKRLEELKKYKAYGSRANLQFVLRAEATLAEAFGKASPEDVHGMLLHALHVTWPDFDESKISQQPLTIDETVLINHMAIHYIQQGELKRASKILEALAGNLDRRYVDERLKASVHGAVMLNLSACYGRMERRLEALEVIDEAEKFARSRGRCSSLPSLYSNKAFNLFRLGHKEQSLATYALAYYTALMFSDYGRDQTLFFIRKRVKEFLDVDFD